MRPYPNPNPNPNLVGGDREVLEDVARRRDPPAHLAERGEVDVGVVALLLHVQAAHDVRAVVAADGEVHAAAERDRVPLLEQPAWLGLGLGLRLG